MFIIILVNMRRFIVFFAFLLKKKANKKENKEMKKTYMAPSVEVIKVDVANMMATSMPIVDGTVNTNDVANQLSREMNRSIEMLNQVWQ